MSLQAGHIVIAFMFAHVGWPGSLFGLSFTIAWNVNRLSRGVLSRILRSEADALRSRDLAECAHARQLQRKIA